ncbi:MAG TPA: PASTA domain-containing protein [Roseiflexaceae bacterium]|nr:PASTA domain-containing protein [Roseiflexaceae bacterium]
MNFLGGALPNVMFIIGVLAIGLGLGIELKLVPLNKEIDKTGRIGAIVVGSLLVAASLYVYLNPALTNQAAPTTASAALPPAVAATANSSQAQAEAPTVPAAAAAAAPEPSATPTPTSAPEPSVTPAPTSTPEPSATSVPTAVPPTEVPSVAVPELLNRSEKEANDMLHAAGLQARKVDQCPGGGEGDSKVKKNRIACQNPAAEARVPLGTIVEYVLSK